MKKIINIGYLLFITFVACQKKVPDFNAENAFEHLKAQCDFGPRNPGSEGHRKVLDYYMKTLTPLADTVMTQSFVEKMPRTSAKGLIHAYCRLRQHFLVSLQLSPESDAGLYSRGS